MIQKLNGTNPEPYHRPNDSWTEVPLATTIDSNGEVSVATAKRRSLRSKRKIFTVAMTAFVIGGLMIATSSPFAKEFIVPGPLASNHAQILAGQGADRCANCHAAADGSVTSWIASTLSIGRAKGVSQTDLCMKCHDKSLNPNHAKNPHNVAPEALAAITANIQNVSFDAGMGFSPPIHGNEIACNACHREHHGSDNDLTLMTDSQCQSCHGTNFHSFATDHPDFTNYPLKRRSAIAFDHSSHALKHFPGKSAEFTCAQCHVDDDFKNVKKLASYEQACATCHDQQIIDSGEQGLAMFALPMIDTDAIEENKLKVGSWPIAATGDFDGAIPPIMRAMLSVDPDASKVMKKYDDNFEFGDIDPEDAEQVKDAVTLVWSIKRLLNELALNGPRTIRSRLEKATGVEITKPEIQSLVTNLDEVVFQNAVRRWLPNLSAEVAINQHGAPDLGEPNSIGLRNLAIKQQEVSWWPADESLYLRIAANSNETANDGEVLATNPLKGLVDPEGASLPRPTAVASSSTTSKPNSDPKPASQPLPIVRTSSQQNENQELLVTNPLQGLKQGARPKVITTQSASIAGQMPKVIAQNPTNSNPNPKSDPMINVVPEYPDRSADRITIPTGWFRNDQTFKINYRPSGHSDDCVKSWINFVTRVADADSRPETNQLFKKMLTPESIGLCRSCHTLDQVEDQNLKINWVASYRDPSVRSFTRFAHGPHLIQPTLEDCSHCHQLDQHANNAETFLGTDPSVSVSNFMPMTKSNCATCHSENQTASGCTQCHNYHVGSKVSGMK